MEARRFRKRKANVAFVRAGGATLLSIFMPTVRYLFQSAPRSELRGDPAARRAEARAGAFQSAPRSELRGDSVTPVACSIGRVFQSAPRSELRGDKHSAGDK